MELMEKIKKTGKSLEKALIPHSDTNDATDILDTLKAEHDEVKDLLAQLLDNPSAPARKSLLKKIKAALVPHLRAEEKVVYDAILSLRDKEPQVNGEEGYLEHALADKMMTTLSKIPNAASPEFTAGAKVLNELVTHHIEEEESNVWEDIRKYFDDDERIVMNRRFEAAKKKVRVS